MYIPYLGKGLGMGLLLAILVSAWYGGLGPGLAATGLILAIAVVVVQGTPPGMTPVKALELILFLGAGAVVSLLVEALHSARRRAETAAGTAEEASRAKDRFLAILSHELRTPLTPVLLAVSDLLERGDLPEEVRATLDLARRNVALEARLIDDLLDATRIARGQLELVREVVDLHEVIRLAAETAQPDLRGGGLTLALDLDAAEHAVEGDAARLQQVVWNLLRNAARFTPPGGSVRVRTRSERGGDGGRARLIAEISDTGIGIAPEAMGRIFQAFEQGDEAERSRRAGGLGLGLAICRAIVEAHGGALTVASDGPGRGSTFAVELEPAAATVVGRAHGGVPSAGPAGGLASPPGLAILLVEDDEATLSVLARLLRARGHRVSAARSIAEARAEAEAGRFDLIISDLGLPDGSGLDLMRELRVGLDVPAIALSGFGMDEDIRRALAAGFDAHLTKPIGVPDLESAIRRVGAGAPRRETA
jgi:signal transduction histidine kinase/CheY-like chemotaxis protein